MTSVSSNRAAPHILIINSYTWRNKGDAAIVMGMVRALREQLPHAVITILSFTPEIDRVHYTAYDQRIEVYSSLLNPYPYKEGLDYLIRTGPRLLFNSVRCLLWAKTGWGAFRAAQADALKSYRTADVILSCGGGFLGGRKWASIVHIYAILFAAFLGKPFIIYSHSVEPFTDPLLAMVTKFALNKATFVTVREEVTLNYLQSVRLKPNMFLSADPSFLLKNVPKAEAVQLLANQGIKRDSRFLMGMTVRRWDFPGHADSHNMRATYLQVMAETIAYLMQQFKGMVVLFPQTIFGPRDDDRVISHRVRQLALQMIGPDGAQHVRVLEEDYSPAQLKGMMGEMDLFVGTRMHSNIFALTMSVPTIAISYEEKSEGIMRMLGLEEYVLPIDSLTMASMKIMIDKTLADSSKIKATLKQKIKKTEDLARYSARLVREFLESQS